MHRRVAQMVLYREMFGDVTYLKIGAAGGRRAGGDHGAIVFFG